LLNGRGLNGREFLWCGADCPLRPSVCTHRAYCDYRYSGPYRSSHVCPPAQMDAKSATLFSNKSYLAQHGEFRTVSGSARVKFGISWRLRDF
jgi:hypothetical protein